MKKLVAILTTIVVVMAIMPMGVFADNNHTENCVAEVGEQHYETLQAAIDAANSGDTIKIIKQEVTTNSIGENETNYYSLTKTITIDLNGNTLTTTQNAGTIITGEGTTLTIKNGTIKSKNLYLSRALFNPQRSCSVVVDNTTIDTSGVALFPAGDAAKVDVKNNSKIYAGGYAVATNASTTENDGVVIALKDSELQTANTYNDNCAVLINVKGTLNIDNCKINAERQAVIVRAGTAIIKDSNIVDDCTFDNDIDSWGQGNNIPMAGLVVGNTNKYSYKATANVTVINTEISVPLEKGKPAILVADNENYETTIKLEGINTKVKGTIRNNTANNKSSINVVDGTFSTVDALRYLAKTGDVNVNVIVDGVDDSFEAPGISIPKAGDSNRNITIDLNNKTWVGTNSLTGSTGTKNQVLQLLKGNNVTIKNGTIRIKESQREPIDSRFIIQNYSNLTLEDVTLDGTNLVANDAYTLSNNCGTINLNGNTNIIATNNRTAFDVSWWPKSYLEGATVNINTEGTIIGNIEMGLYGTKGENNEDNKLEDTKSKINIINGHFKGAFIKAPEYPALYPTGLTDDERETMYKKMLTITGGTFSSDPSEYVASGYYCVNEDGTYTVHKRASSAKDNVTNNITEKNTTADLTPSISGSKANTTVDNNTAGKIISKAIANKSTEIIIDAAGGNTVASSEVGIPETTVKELSEKTDANLVIKTDNGKVDLDKTALAAVAAQAGTTGTVKLIVETIKTDENICHVALKLVTSKGNVTDFKGGNVKVTVRLDKELADKELVCVYINDNGIYTIVDGVLNADGTYTFTTGHFSEYAVMPKDDADNVITKQLNTLIKDVNLKATTVKTTKKNVKVTVTGDVTALKDAGYTVKYKFYRSTKKASKYNGMKLKKTNTYTNTIGKKGTKYYYKAKVMVYDGDKLVGQTALKQCRYGARAWNK